jgi:two-component system sensor histidine kinase QseC
VQVHNLLAEASESSKSLEELQQGIDMMGRLVEQILVLNRTAPDQYMMQFVEVDLYSLAQDIVSNDFEQFLLKNQSFELQGESVLFRGDITALRSLIQNLLSNASKYTPVGGKIVLRINHERDAVFLTIEDSGPGIDVTYRGRVFDRFYRLQGDQHYSGISGSGLGLAIVKHIVDMHRAKISLGQSSTLGGLQIEIKFPITEASDWR